MADTDLEALPARGTLLDTDIVYVVDPVTNLPYKLTVSALKAALGTEVTKTVTTQQNSSSTTLAAVTQLAIASLAPGTYRYKVEVVWQAAAATTGINVVVRGAGGTVTRNVGHHYTTTTSNATTQTGIADQATAAASFQNIESRAWRSNTTDGGPFAGVDTAAADQFSVVEGIIVVTATLTSLDVLFAAEVAAQVSIMPGTTFFVEKVA